MKKVVIDLAATDPEMVPSWATVAAVDAQFRVLSDTKACTASAFTPPPEILTLTLAADPLELMATTATVPSSFRNAAVRTPFPPPLDPTLTAPGRTYRDQLANAHSRFDTSYVLVRLSTRISFSFVFGFGHCTPSHHRNPEILLLTTAL
jgi:hypothetical protein